MRAAALLGTLALLLPAGASGADEYARFQKALASFNEGIYFGSISEARAQLRDTPGHAPSQILIARASLKLGKCPAAAEAAAAAANLMGQSAAGTSAGEQEALTRVIAQLDVQCGASLELARVYVQSKDYKRAADYYRGYLSKNPADLDARLEYARVLSWDKDYAGAADHFKRYLSARGSDIEAVLGLADVYAWSGNHRAAEAQLRKALAAQPNNVEAVLKLGRVYEWQGEYARARSEYERAARMPGGVDQGREGIERVKELAVTKRRPTASAAILAELETSGNFSLYLKYGDALYHNEGKAEEAIAAYRRYIAKFPDDAKGPLKLARVLGWEKRYPESAEMFREYLAKSQDDVAARLELANVLAWGGRHAEALAELDEVKRRAPSEPAAFVAAGDIARWRRDFPTARDNYETALGFDPKNAAALAGLRLVEENWSPAPVARAGAEGVSVDDIGFRRLSQEVRAELRFHGGRVGVTPGLRNHHLRQKGRLLEAREGFFEVTAPIQNDWRWWGGVSGLDVIGRATKAYGSIGVEGSFSTHTWLKFGYAGRDAVFESNNLGALLGGTSVRLDDYRVEFSRIFFGANEVRGFASAGFLSDTNSRARVLVRALHKVCDAPTVKVGAAYKTLSYAQASPLYWSPSGYAGGGLTAEIGRSWAAFSYRAALTLYRITQTKSTESSFEAGVAYRPREGFFGELGVVSGRGAGASVSGTNNTAYKSAELSAGYRF